MKSSENTSLISEAIDLGTRYNYDEEVAQLRATGKCPPGWGRKVGQDIAMFMNPPPLGGLLQSKEAYREEREDDRRHGRQLAKLRVLIAKLNRR